MLNRIYHVVRRALVPGFFLGLFWLMLHCASAQAQAVVTTNFNLRVMAANTTSGNLQRYEPPGLRIFQGLKPDVVAVQEFNYVSTNGQGTNTPLAMREMIDAAFGTNFYFYREPGSYSIPNGIISRWPIVASNSWEDVDTGVNDRGFAWVRIDLPGTNDLYVVSVHLKAQSGSTNPARRAAQAAQLTSLIQSNFPSNAWIIVAGDCNAENRNEACLTTFKTFLSDSPVPDDGNLNGTPNPNTNEPRAKPYDYVLPSFTLDTNRVATVIGSRTFANGLVFDSRVYSPLVEVAPVVVGDSGVTGMQHMAVVKDFRISYTVTNQVTTPPPPLLTLVSASVFRWAGPSNLTYRVLGSGSLSNFTQAGTSSSLSTNYFFTNSAPLTNQRFFRVVWP